MNAAWYRYEIDLGRVVRLGPHDTRIRRGYILRLEDDTGRVSAGEAAPIDGFGPDTEADVLAVLGPVAERLAGARRPRDLDELRGWADRTRDWPCTVRFAVESALMYLAADEAGVSPGDWLGGVERPLIDVCLLGSLDAADGSTDAALSTGGVVKLKTGNGNPVDEGRAVAERLAASSGVRVRCDANRAWSLDDARAFLDAFQRAGGDVDRFEFLEEPIGDPAGLAELSAGTPVPIALDETVLESGSEFEPGSWEGIRYFVVKPSLFGGLVDGCRLAQRVRAYGGRLIVSSAFESGLGLATVAWLASIMPGPAAGFGTVEHVLNDEIPIHDALLENPIRVLNLPHNPGSTVRFDLLEAIDD